MKKIITIEWEIHDTRNLNGGFKTGVSKLEVKAKGYEEIINAFNTARENMIKRLNTYLKKYGLSKLNIWTYLRD